MLSEKGPKNIERERRRGFRATFFLTFSGTPYAKHLLSKRVLDGHGPKLVSKVSDSYDAVQQNSKKPHASAPSRAKSDDPLTKNNDFGTLLRIPRIPSDSPDPAEMVAFTAARTPLPHAQEARMTVVTQTPSNQKSETLSTRINFSEIAKLFQKC